MKSPNGKPPAPAGDAETLRRCEQELATWRSQAAAAAKRTDRFDFLLRAVGELQLLLFQESDRHLIIQDLCALLVERKYYPHVWIVLWDAQGQAEATAQAGFPDTLEKIARPREANGWVRCLQKAHERSAVISIADPAFSCGPCALSAACQRQGQLVANIGYGHRVFGALCVGLPRTSLAHEEEKSTLRLLANALGSAFFRMEFEPDSEKSQALAQEFARLQAALNVLPTPLAVYDQQGQPRWRNIAENRRRELAAGGNDARRWLTSREAYAGPDGTPGGAVEIAWDATEQMLLERFLRDTGETYRQMLAAGQDFLWILDAAGKFVCVSPQIQTLLGYAPEELMGRTLLEFLNPLQGEKHENGFQRLLQAVSPLEKMRCGVRHRDGREMILEISAEPMLGPTGTCLGFRGRCRDLTEQKRTEKALKESEARFHKIFTTLPTPLCLISPRGRVVEINPSMVELLGIVDEAAIRQVNALDFLPLSEETLDTLRAHRTVRQEATYDPACYQGRPEFKFLQAGVLHLEVLVSLFPWEQDSQEEGYLLQLHDITERKNAEDALCQSEEKYRTIFENSGTALVIINEDLTLSLVNRETEILTGYTTVELLGGNTWFKLVLPEDREKIKNYHLQRRVNPASVPRAYEIRFQHKNGERRTVLASAALIPSAQQSLVALVDITKRKLMEEALRLSEEKYRATFENSGNALALIEEDLTVSLANPEMETLLGLPCGEIEGRKKWTEFLAQDSDLEKFEHYRKLLQADPGALPKSCECAVRRHGGQPREVMAAMTYLPASRQVLVTLADITERKAVERNLRESEQHYRLLADNIRDIIWMSGPDHRLTFISPSVTRLRGLSVEAALAQSLEEAFTPESVQRLRLWHANAASTPEKKDWNDPLELEQFSQDGSTVWTEVYINPVRDAAGSIQGFVGISRDISARRQAEAEQQRLEDQLRQSQKMEIIGHLAGGIAHDFNNLLTPILGYADMASAQVPAGTPLSNDLKAIQETAERAARLTRQLLAFSLKQVLHMSTVQLNREILDFIKLLHSFIGEHIEVRTELATELGCIKADLTQVQQVLMNLAVNARDAMPRGGCLTLSTANVTVDEALVKKHPSLNPGFCVRLTVADTGVGIAPEILGHIFEPFFTTKERGKGTGLGLSMVYGIVTQHRGALVVESEPGRGSAFHIYFPLVETTPAPIEPLALLEGKGGGRETILVVEDEPMVRKLAQEFLAGQGYTVWEASSPSQALENLRQRPADFDLLLTDIIMPGMNGKELYQQLAQERPGLKVLYMSGYSEDVIAHQGVLEPGIELLAKPFSLKALLAKVRRVLDQSVSGTVTV